MGSGGLVVLDDRDCAVEIARYFLQFTQNESCGKCTYCRVGTKRMLEILERVCDGRGVEGDIETLEELSSRVKSGSLRGLGQTAPTPVLTTLRYFRDEYEAHVRERRCPAAVCKTLIRYRVLIEINKWNRQCYNIADNFHTCAIEGNLTRSTGLIMEPNAIAIPSRVVTSRTRNGCLISRSQSRSTWQ